DVSVFRLELARCRNAEHPPLPPCEEVRRLTEIRAARIDVIAGSDWNVELLPRIAVVIAHQERAAAVLVVIPALERAGHAVAGAARRFRNRDALRRQENAASEYAGGAKEPEPIHCCFSLLLSVALASLAFRSACSALYSSSVKYVTFIQACAISSTV